METYVLEKKLTFFLIVVHMSCVELQANVEYYSLSTIALCFNQ